MNRTILILLLVIAILGIAFWGNQKGWFVNSKVLRDFALTDTSGVDKIYLVEKNGKDITLENVGGIWMVNKTYEANRAYLDQMFESMQKFQVKSPVPQSEMESVIKLIAGSHTKVEVYKHNTLYKTYYISQGTSQKNGTYMLLEGSSEPFIVSIPGFDGILTPQFHTNLIKWRSPVIFRIKPEDIMSVKMEFPTSKDEDYQVDYHTSGYHISPVPHIKIDSGFIYYIKGFFYGKKGDGVYAEGIGAEMNTENTDSIYKSTPMVVITVMQKGNKKDVLRIHAKNLSMRTKAQFDPQTLETAKYDTEHYYAFKNGSSEPMLIQDYIFGALLRKRSQLAAQLSLPQ